MPPMTSSRKIVKIFLASPGDLQEERQAAKAVVDEFNKQWADRLGIHVELVGWEDTVSRYGRPQELINQELDRCEAFIGIIWKRWGSPPDKGAGYTSGFEEEFERSIKSKEKSGKPEISLFFKDVDAELLKDPGDDLRKVTAFKNKIIEQKNILFEKFGNRREFEAKARSCITSYVQYLSDIDESQKSGEAQTRLSADSAKSQANPTSPSHIKSLPKSRLKRLLIRYTDHEGSRYYNVIHWLDMGVSLPKDRVESAVQKIVARE
jgi:Domain of unknown function (DUF4062)